MRYNDNQPMHRVGRPTQQTVIFKSESHKLHQAFPVAKDDAGKNKVLIPGQPAKLNEDGTIEAYFGEGIYLGIAVTSSEYPCYPEGALGAEVTVAVEGYMVLFAQAGEEIKAGAVVPAELTDDSQYVTYNQDADNTDPKFIAISTAAEAGELIQVLIR